MKLLHAEDGGRIMYVMRLEGARLRVHQYDGIPGAIRWSARPIRHGGGTDIGAGCIDTRLNVTNHKQMRKQL